jgi:hypothetical protein
VLKIYAGVVDGRNVADAASFECVAPTEDRFMRRLLRGGR